MTAPPPPSLPRPRRMSKQEWRGVLFPIVAIALLWLVRILLGWFALPAVVSETFEQLHMLVAVAVVPVGVGMFLVGWRRHKRSLTDNDLRVCTRCHQILKGLPDEGRCPECGTPYVMSLVQQAWEHEYPSLRLRHREQPRQQG